MSVINMSKNQTLDMSKIDGTAIRKYFIGANWDKTRYAMEAKSDLDISGFATNDRKVQYPEDLVNYTTYGDGEKYPWCKFSGDNQTGDDTQGIDFNGEHYDEYFIVDADKFPTNRSEFYICLTIFRALEREQSFGMIENATMTICDYDDPNGSNVYKYDFSKNKNFESLNAIEIGKLYRSGDGFRFQALGSGYTGGMTELYKNFGLDIDEGRD